MGSSEAKQKVVIY